MTTGDAIPQGPRLNETKIGEQVAQLRLAVTQPTIEGQHDPDFLVYTDNLRGGTINSLN